MLLCSQVQQQAAECMDGGCSVALVVRTGGASMVSGTHCRMMDFDRRQGYAEPAIGAFDLISTCQGVWL